MKKFLFVFTFVAFFFLFPKDAAASPTNNHKAENNPNVVANFDTGTHGIPGESETHTGEDLVMAAGKSGNFHQWFVGESGTEGHHGEHSLWQVTGTPNCQNASFLEYPDPNPDHGSYLVDGTTYCVHTNGFLNGQGLGNSPS